MLFDNISQYAVLALLLAIGWLFGFASHSSHSSGKPRRGAPGADASRRARDRAGLDAQLRESEKTIAVLETRNAELAAALAQAVRSPVTSAPMTVTKGKPASAFGIAAVDPEVRPLPIKRGWFDWGKGDDLRQLRGVDAALEEKLKTEKVDRFSEIADLTDQEEIALERRLDLPAGYLMKEQLRDQARLLAEGDTAAHAERFGTP